MHVWAPLTGQVTPVRLWLFINLIGFVRSVHLPDPNGSDQNTVNNNPQKNTFFSHTLPIIQKWNIFLMNEQLIMSISSNPKCFEWNWQFFGEKAGNIHTQNSLPPVYCTHKDTKCFWKSPMGSDVADSLVEILQGRQIASCTKGGWCQEDNERQGIFQYVYGVTEDWMRFEH